MIIMSDNNDFKMVAKTFFGLEEVLSNELLSLGAKKIEKGVRNVSFFGDLGFLNNFLNLSTIPSFAFWETKSEWEKKSEFKTDSIEKVSSKDK